MNDAELLNRYLEDHDQDAFRQLVERHAGMVYGVALRRSRSIDVAEEATQTVFIQLAKKAGVLKQPERLAGWLHRSVLLETAHLLRKTRLEKAGKERLVDAMEAEAEVDGDWNVLIPVIDEALNQLPPSDRELLLAKYYEGFTYREIATRQRRAEATARKQGSRALEKLQRLLVRKGVTVSTVVLGTALKPGLSVACPIGLVDVIEGRVGDLATSKGAVLTASLASAVIGSPWVLLVITALAALLPTTLGWGRRVSIEAPLVGKESVRPSLLNSSRVILPVGAAALPTIEEILAARGSDQLGLVLRWLPEADAETLAQLGEGLSQELDRRSSWVTGERVWVLLLQRWLALDSDAALAFATRFRDSGKRYKNKFLSEERLHAWWAQVDPESAMASATSKSMGLVIKTLNGLAPADPAHALALANALPAEAAASLDWRGLFENLAKQDPHAALEAAKVLVNPLARDQALQECLKRLGQEDPEQALSQLDTISGFLAREEVSKSLMESWFESDVASAVRALEGMKPSLKTLKLTRSATVAWAKQDPDAAQTWAASQQTPSLERAAFSGLATAFAGTDFVRAEEAFRQLDWDLTDIDSHKGRQTSISRYSSGTNNKESLGEAASQWLTNIATGDVGEALRLAGSFKDETGGLVLYRVRQDLSRKWMREDPKGLERFIVEQEDTSFKLSLAKEYAAEALNTDEAISWAKTLGGEASKATLTDVFKTLAETDSNAAIAKLPELNGLDGDTQGEVVSRVVYATDPKFEGIITIVHWLEEQPDQEVLDKGYEAIVFKMATHDEVAARNFVQEEMQGPARDGVAAGMLMFLMSKPEKDHAEALQWLQATERIKSRNYWLPLLAKDWLKEDPETAMKVIPTTELDSDSWQRLLDQHQSQR